MTNSQSKILSSLAITCRDFQHPWTDSCVNASAGVLLASLPYCLRVYTMVYALSLVMRHRIPNSSDLKKTFLGIIQSTAFLVTNAYTFSMFNCLIRHLLGGYYFSTVAFVPAFCASLMAISVERPERRSMLALYVANVATESLWNMAEARGFVRSLPHAQTLIFGLSISVLLYIYRLGLHKTTCEDSIYNILKIFVGQDEEGPIRKLTIEPEQSQSPSESKSQSRPPLNFQTIQCLLQIYTRFIDFFKSKHFSCPHRESTCLKYAAIGGLKPLVSGITLQVTLKLVMNIKKIVQMKMDWRKQIFNRSTLNLGIFLGSFSLLYKSVSCILRHIVGRDEAIFAIPASLIGSIGFFQYPDTTVALYVMWKTVQLIYNLGVEKGIVPPVPGFIFIFYSLCTATLFHAALLEPKRLRPSYYKFLQAISGERLTKFATVPFDIFGHKTSQQSKEVMEKLKMFNHSNVPKFALPSGI